MPIGGHLPVPSNQPVFVVLCPPCRVGLHDECRGGVVTCECFVEVLLEAEERDE